MKNIILVSDLVANDKHQRKLYNSNVFVQNISTFYQSIMYIISNYVVLSI